MSVTRQSRAPQPQRVADDADRRSAIAAAPIIGDSKMPKAG